MNVYHIILEQISTGHTGHAMTFRGLNEEAGRKHAEEGIAMRSRSSRISASSRSRLLGE